MNKSEHIAYIISKLCTKYPPINIVDDWLNNTNEELQDFVIYHTLPELINLTGIGLIEGAIFMVEDAISNGNIKNH